MNTKILAGLALLLLLGGVGIYWKSAHVVIPESQDVVQSSTTTPVALNQNQKTAKVDTTAPSIGADADYAVVGNDVYVKLFGPMCAISGTTMIQGADAATFVYLGHDYAKDKDHVYYLGDADPCSRDPEQKGNIITLANAHSSQFTVVEYPYTFKKGETIPSDEKSIFLGLDSASRQVYAGSTVLSGIDPSSIVIESYGAIIRDEDTAWFIDPVLCGKGGIGSISDRYKQGTISEISNYSC